MTEKAFAKLNLTLDVGEKRADGYHEVRTVMQEISLYDTVGLTVMPAKGKGSVLLRLGKVRNLPTDDHNLCVRAAKAFLRAYGIEDRDVDIFLEKNIPLCSGMGGGSSDAAAVLRMLNRETGVNAPDDELERLGATLGADVPFFIRGGTQLAEGFGERLVPLSLDRREIYVAAKPADGILTPDVFNAFDTLTEKEEPKTDAFLAALSENRDPYGAIGNALLPAVKTLTQSVFALCGLFEKTGARTTMSGSGTTVFGVYRSYFKAARALRMIEQSGAASFAKIVLPIVK